MTGTDEIERLATQLLGPISIKSVRPCPLAQRHLSWAVALSSGERCWVKLGRHETAVAGVRREAAVLHQLDERWFAPRLMAYDRRRPVIATQHLDGRMLAEHEDDEVYDLLRPLASWLQSFRTCGALAAHPPSVVASWDLFGTDPDVNRLLDDGAAFWTRAAHRRGIRASAVRQRRLRPAAGGVVHGSFDEDNLLIDDARAVSGVLDFEATRVGPSAIDVAGMAVDLLLHRGASLARAWLDTCSDDLDGVSAFLQLRLWHLHQHDPLSDRVVTDALRLIEDLV